MNGRREEKRSNENSFEGCARIRINEKCLVPAKEEKINGGKQILGD